MNITPLLKKADLKQHKSFLFQEQFNLCTVLTNYEAQRVYEFNNLPDNLRRYQQLGISDFWGSSKERVDSGGCAACGGDERINNEITINTMSASDSRNNPGHRYIRQER